MLYMHRLNLHPIPIREELIVSIFQIRKLRLGKVKCLVQGHVDRKESSPF